MKRSTLLFGFLAAGAVMLFSSQANAQYYGGNQGYGNYGYSQPYNSTPSYGYQGGYTAPVYHPPSVHFDRVYRPTQLHWTPRRGVHTHGYQQIVPHYTPGHFDTRHGNHVHPNSYFHR